MKLWHHLQATTVLAAGLLFAPDLIHAQTKSASPPAATATSVTPVTERDHVPAPDVKMTVAQAKAVISKKAAGVIADDAIYDNVMALTDISSIQKVGSELVGAFNFIKSFGKHGKKDFLRGLAAKEFSYFLDETFIGKPDSSLITVEEAENIVKDGLVAVIMEHDQKPSLRKMLDPSYYSAREKYDSEYHRLTRVFTEKIDSLDASMKAKLGDKLHDETIARMMEEITIGLFQTCLDIPPVDVDATNRAFQERTGADYVAYAKERAQRWKEIGAAENATKEEAGYGKFRLFVINMTAEKVELTGEMQRLTSRDLAAAGLRAGENGVVVRDNTESWQKQMDRKNQGGRERF